MAIFSCVSPNAHQTLPRSSSRPVRRPGLQTSNDGSNDAKAVRVSARPMSWNGQMPARALSSRDLSKRNGAKLQKRARVSKTMIGVPTNFVHCSHMERGDAKNAFSSKELRDIQGDLLAPFTDQAKDGNVPQESQEANDARDLSLPVAEAVGQAPPSTQPVPAAPAKRKAPPPITASIIKAAGLPSPDHSNAPPVPAVPEAGEILVIEKKKRPISVPSLPAEEAVVPTTVGGGFYAEKSEMLTVGRANGHLAAAPLPPTVSSIRRDIEKLLDGPVDGMPTDGEPSTSDDLLSAPTSASPAKHGISHSSTLRNLALSSSMENIVDQAITVDDEKVQQDKLTRSNTISKADPADLLKLELAVENLRKDFGDERHDSLDSFTTAIPAPTPQQM